MLIRLMMRSNSSVSRDVVASAARRTTWTAGWPLAGAGPHRRSRRRSASDQAPCVRDWGEYRQKAWAGGVRQHGLIGDSKHVWRPTSNSQTSRKLALRASVTRGHASTVFPGDNIRAMPHTAHTRALSARHISVTSTVLARAESTAHWDRSLSPPCIGQSDRSPNGTQGPILQGQL